MKKRLLALLLACSMVFALAACGGNGQSGTPEELFADYGLTAENIAENARRLVK